MRDRLLPLRGLLAVLATASCARFIPPPEPLPSPELAIRKEAVRQVAALRAAALGDSLPLAACSWRRFFGSDSAGTVGAVASHEAAPPVGAANDAAGERVSPAGRRTLLPPAPAPRFDTLPAASAPCEGGPRSADFVGYRLPNPPMETWHLDEIRRRGDEVLVRVIVDRVHYSRPEAWWFRVVAPPRGGRPAVLSYAGSWISNDWWRP